MILNRLAIPLSGFFQKVILRAIVFPKRIKAILSYRPATKTSIRSLKHLPKISCKVISHKKQRYDTFGDYWWKGDNWEFRISELTPEAELAVLIHELVEFFLTNREGIKEEDITAFDIRSGLRDPGDCPDAPYYFQHKAAEKVEMAVIEALGMKWSDYCDLFED